MKQYHYSDASLSEVHESIDTTQHKKGFRRFLAYIGPAYLVSVGYMDPGNWATDLQGGAKFGYQLIWVLLMSNLMALLLQSLSARLGIVRRRDLAQANRETYPPVVNFCLYVLAEFAIAACDLAEVLGMAIGIHLLFPGIPILWGVMITVLDTFLLLWLQRYGIRKIEAFIIMLVATIAGCFLIEIFFAKPQMGAVVRGFMPTSLNTEALYIAVGIIGATVMPHNLYLHSALVQTRKISNDTAGIRKAIRFNIIDSTIALNLAFFVNAAILVLAGTVFYKAGVEVARIQDAHRLLEGFLGSKFAPLLFAIALIAAGQSSTVTGTLAGQIVMEGYLRLRINPWLRRLITRLLAVVPAIIVILIYGDDKVDDLLVLSQVILSMQLGFAIIPLIHFVSDKKTMGPFTISTTVKILSWLVAAILVFLNVKLVAEETITVFDESGMIGWKITIVIAWLVFAWLFLTMTFLPFFRKQQTAQDARLHSADKPLINLSVASLGRIAVALDFSDGDEKLIAQALQQGKKEASYVLLHIVESATAKYSGESSDDYETRRDRERLQSYVAQLQALGYTAKEYIGFKNRVKEIVRIVRESKAEMLVMGAHRHAGLKDYIFGQTIEAVRHELEIPVLIVNI